MEYILAFLLSMIIAYVFQRRRLQWWWYPLILAPIVFIAAYRTIDIGRDTHYTYDWFWLCLHSHTIKYPLLYLGKSELFIAVLFYLTRFVHDFNLCLFVIHTITYGCVLFSLSKVRKYGLIAVGLIIYLLFFYRESYNTIRQAMAVCLCMVSFTYLLKSQYVKPILLTFIAYGFHHSAYVFLFVIFLKYITDRYNQATKKKWIKFIYLIAGISFLLYFQTIAIFLGGLGIIEDGYIEGYTDSSHFGTNLPISVLAMNIVNLITFLYLPKNSRIISQNRLFMEYNLITAFLCSFLGLISMFAVRVGSYFWGMSPLIFMLLFDRNNRKSFVFYIYIAFACLSWVLTIIIANLGDTYPYKSILTI